ncbi:programmed cell death protein 7-like [Ostrinia nubilalis]|uniref:programmed cell death protein 7-like n=1 Tax=Ostrinia nubilalis TaxID=29057 RepID=UPI0030825CA6
MSNNHHFYNNFRGNHHTFQTMRPPGVVPPPPPPPRLFFMPPPSPSAPTLEMLDNECAREMERKLPKVPIKRKTNTVSISEVRNKLRDLILTLNDLRDRENLLTDKIDSCSDKEWRSELEEVKLKKAFVRESLSEIKTTYTSNLGKAIAKRTAKRQRLKRRNIELKRAKEERIKELEERSRKIDENLQKIKDAVIKAKEEEEAKLQADVILKEVLRKKHNAKKFITKLDALKKLRKARMNTAKGRGENVSEKEAEEFDGKIDKLKLLWGQKLIGYEKEEQDLRDKLKQDSDEQKAAKANEMEKQMTFNLRKWKRALFGDSTANPQVNFNGHAERFVAVRCQWDQFLDSAGTPLPVGWVVPAKPADS